MTPRSPQSGIPPIIRKPPIAEELDKLREKPPRATNREPLLRLERMAILDGLSDGDAPGRIATQWKISTKTVRQRHVLAHFFAHHIAQYIDLGGIR